MEFGFEKMCHADNEKEAGGGKITEGVELQN